MSIGDDYLMSGYAIVRLVFWPDPRTSSLVKCAMAAKLPVVVGGRASAFNAWCILLLLTSLMAPVISRHLPNRKT